MGNVVFCPAGFQPGPQVGTCIAECPEGFEYSQEGGVQRCVYIYDNGISYTLNAIVSPPPKSRTEPRRFENERSRINAELARVWKEIADKTRTAAQLAGERNAIVGSYSRIQSEYAAVNDTIEPAKVMKEVANSLKPFRPPTAPDSDIEKERKAIVDMKALDLLVVQVALFVTVLVLVAYIILPRGVAHVVAFMLVVVGIAFGFFLQK